jgi:hypothetical protein
MTKPVIFGVTPEFLAREELGNAKSEWKKYDDDLAYPWGNAPWIQNFNGSKGTLNPNSLIDGNSDFGFATSNQMP